MSSRGHTLRRLRGLRLRDWTVLVHAFLLAPYVWTRLRLRGVQRVVAPAGVPRDASAAELSSVSHLVRLAGAACRRSPIPSTCVTQALVAQRVLRTRGIAAQVMIGVASGDAPFRAHAWLEWRGRVVGEAEDPLADFAPLGPFSLWAE